ncbi:MAG TPA: hypothetical protein VN958_18120, partial [Chitinophagaceae bacterium]|nr:hypothetical protein [Chitinophagaceae bacterium]
MFLAGDALNRREQKIRDFVDKEPAIAVLLAAANFEWTLCRALLFLSKTPNQELRHKIAGVRGFDSYKKLWHKELVGLYNGKRLPEVIKNRPGFLEGFEMRNKLIHGQDRVTRNMAIPKIEAMLQAVRDIDEYCNQMGYDL